MASSIVLAAGRGAAAHDDGGERHANDGARLMPSVS